MKVIKGIVKGTLSLMLVGLGLFGGQVGAAAITVNNFSFEVSSAGSPDTCPISDWTCTNNNSSMGIRIPTGTAGGDYPIGANGLSGGLIVPDGTHAAFIRGVGQQFSQNTAALIADNTSYTLNVFVGHAQDKTWPGGSIVLTHSTAVGVIGTAIAGAAFTLTDPGDGQWLNETLSFATTTGLGDPFQGQFLGIALIAGPPGSTEIDFDNVRLDASSQNGPNAVPEPTSLLLLGSGLVGFGLWRWKKGQA